MPNTPLTTAEAAALLADRGILVRDNPPRTRTIEAWCKRGVIRATRIGGPRRAIYLIDVTDLDGFEPPVMGRRRRD